MKVTTTRGWPLKRRLAYYSKSTKSGCRVWIGAITVDGYGRLTVGHSNPIGAHRLAWQAFRGPIPKGMHVLHTCDNPSCINPNHLYLGNHKDNMRDKTTKLRAAKKLTPNAVRAIRKRTDSQYRIAKDHKISQSTVWEILVGKIWGHVP